MAYNDPETDPIDIDPNTDPALDPDRTPAGTEDADAQTEEPAVQPKRQLDAEEKLKRARAAEKRAKREAEGYARRLADQDGLNAAILSELKAMRETQNAHQTEAVRRAEESLVAEYQAAEAELEAAFIEGDAKKIVKAQGRLNFATNKVASFESQRAQQSTRAERDVEQRVQPRQQQTQQRGAPEWVDDWRAEHTWFAGPGEDAEDEDAADDSEIVKAISAKLEREGISPHSSKHREELDRRLRKRLPHRYGVDPNRQRPRATAAGSPRGGTAAAGSVNRAPAATVAAWEAAGLFDRAAERGQTKEQAMKQLEGYWLQSRNAQRDQ